MPEPVLSEDITASELDPGVRRDLRGLQRDTADTVAKHLVAAGRLVDEDPERALEHARFARARASRIAVVREAAGIVAYHAGEWAEALGELRAARRMGGGPGHLAVMADIERALGRPERALELSRGPEARELDRAESIELAIVAAGARRDMGELDAAVVSLQIAELEPARRDPWSPRLFYAYADNLLAAGRESDALQWFVHAADADEDGETDAARRIAELTGEPLPEDDFAFGEEDEPVAGDGGTDVDGDVADTADDPEATDGAAGAGTGADTDATEIEADDSGADGSDFAAAGPVEADSAGSGSGRGDSRSGVADSDDADSDDADSDDADSDDAASGDVDSAGGTSAGEADSGDADSGDADSVDADSTDADSGSGDSGSGDSGSGDSGSAVGDSDDAGSRSDGSGVADSRAADSGSADSGSADSGRAGAAGDTGVGAGSDSEALGPGAEGEEGPGPEVSR